MIVEAELLSIVSKLFKNFDLNFKFKISHKKLLFAII